MQLNETLAFVSVVAAGSFTAGARKLGVPKSTVSRQVTRLEQRLGARLLQRTTRKLSLTETGAAYYARCSGAIDTIEEAERVAQAVADQARGLIKVTVPFDFGRLYLAPLLPAFRERYPHVELNVKESQGRVDLVAEGIDVALRGGKLADSDFVSRKLADSSIVLCAAPAYLDARGRPERVEDLSEHDALVMTADGRDIPWVLTGPEGEVRLPLRPIVRANEWGFLLEAMLGGLGLGPMLVATAHAELDSGKLERVLPDYGLHDGGLYAVYPSRHHLSPKVRVFVEFLAEHLPALL